MDTGPSKIYCAHLKKLYYVQVLTNIVALGPPKNLEPPFGPNLKIWAVFLNLFLTHKPLWKFNLNIWITNDRTFGDYHHKLRGK